MLQLKKWEQIEIDTCITYLLEIRDNFIPCYISNQLLPDMNTKQLVTVIKDIIVNTREETLFIIYLKKKTLFRELFSVLNSSYYSNVFFYDELLICPLDNILVPKHELCTKKQVKKLLKDNNILLEQLPKITALDPIVRWNNWTTGNVITIYRNVDEEKYYRLVVENTF